MLLEKANTIGGLVCFRAFFCLALFFAAPAFSYQTSTHICDLALDAAADKPNPGFTDDRNLPTIVPKYKRVHMPQRDDYVDPKAIPDLVTPALEKFGFSEVKKIASGGMGTVFQAKKDGKSVILKVLHNEANYLDTFEHEAAVMNRLHSIDPRFPGAERFNIIGEDGKPFRAMEIEFIPKRPGSNEPADTLAALLKDASYWLKNPDARDSIRRQYNALLLKAHKQGISHYDIKPANILISFDAKGDPVVHVIDWGLASQRSDAGFLQSPALRQGNVFGTLGYISQRRLRGGAPNEEDDVFAARVVDWHLRNSHQGFQGPVVLRNLNPIPKPGPSSNPRRTNNPEDVASTVVPEGSPPLLSDSSPKPDQLDRDSSGFQDQFKEPAHALDFHGTEKDRVVAMAEFSLLPKTIVEREQLITSARVLSAEVFLEQMGRRLSEMEELASSNGTRPNMATEILSSTVLVDNFDTRSGLKLSKEHVDAVAKTAAQFYKDTRKYAADPLRLGWFGPHQGYHYQDLAHKIDQLAAAGITKPWKEWLAEVD